jgi:hypothetical protein
MLNGSNDEILQLYRYLADRNVKVESDSQEYSTNTNATLGNYHRTDRIKVKAKGFTYKRITKIRSIRI